jgi:oligopeptide transport system substrate-binding protein
MPVRLLPQRFSTRFGQRNSICGRFVFAVPTMVFAALLLSGCHGATTSTGACAGDRANNTPDVHLNTNSLRYPITEEPTTLDPATVRDGTTIDLLQQIYEGLVIWNTDNQIVPGMAESWNVSADGKTYTFHIRHGVKFPNGREVTAQDFKYTLDRTWDPATKSATASDYLADIVGAADRIHSKPGVTEVAGVRVVDTYTLEIKIDSFKPYWVGNMAQPVAYVVCKEAIEANCGRIDGVKSAVGTGPFTLASYKPNYSIILAANPQYHAGKPKLDFIERPVLLDSSARLNNYEAGKLDYCEIAPRDLDKVKASPALKADLKSYARAATWYVGMNADAPNSPFGKKEVRQAFAMAVDKKEAVRIGLKNMADVADGVVPNMPGTYQSTAKPLLYDPVKARQLLAAAGYPGGKGFPTISFSFRQDYPQVQDTAAVIASQLKTNLGVDVQLKPMEWSTFLNDNAQKNQAFFLERWGADYLDPQDYLSILLHSSKKVNGTEDHPENTTGYNNPEFDKLCDQADVEHNPKIRMAMYHKAEQLAIDDAPWIPIYYQRDIELDKPNVKNIRDGLFGHLPHTTTTVER